MLYVTVELWPGGYEPMREVIATSAIWRVNGPTAGGLCDYQAVLTDGHNEETAHLVDEHALDLVQKGKRFTITGHRYADGVWPLVSRVAGGKLVP